MSANSITLVFMSLVALALFLFLADGSGGTNSAVSPPTETPTTLTVNTIEGLPQAVKNPKTSIIVIQGFLADVPGFRLTPRQSLRGSSPELPRDWESPSTDSL